MTLYEITSQKLYYFRYSENTIKSYLYYVDEFERSVNKHYSRLTASDIQEYVNKYEFKSTSQQNQIISALKFAWEKGLKKKYLKIDFKRPRKEKRLPRVIDKDLILTKLNGIKNLKHKAILSLAFSVGLRVSEVINLKLDDIDSNRMIIHVKNAKGRKDRVVPLSSTILNLLRDYFRAFQPKIYMFNGQFSLQYSAVSCNKIFKKHIDSFGHFHMLRHSSFTSLLEGGTDLRVIQKIAGHSSSRTTEIYTHVSTNMLSRVNLPL